MGLLEEPGASVARGTDHSLTACPGAPFPTHFPMPYGLLASSSAPGEADLEGHTSVRFSPGGWTWLRQTCRPE